MKNIYQTNINPRLKVMHLLDTIYYRAIVIHSDKQDSYTMRKCVLSPQRNSNYTMIWFQKFSFRYVKQK